MRLKLILAYDGRPYSGWQVQPDALTVQGVIIEALQRVAKCHVQLHGAGRTDTGVHADGQTAHFDVPEHIGMNPHNWVPALNAMLPATIRVLKCEEVAEQFHARFSAQSKQYRYALCISPILAPMMAGRAWHLPSQLNSQLLEQALSHYLGQHDFRAFAANRGNENEATNYVRTLTQSEVKETSSGYQIFYRGNGFMYKMVRLLTGAAVRVAQGKMRIDEHLALLDQQENLPYGKSPYCAPADGLTMMHVEY